jgi:hypothetical protein
VRAGGAGAVECGKRRGSHVDQHLIALEEGSGKSSKRGTWPAAWRTAAFTGVLQVNYRTLYVR